MPSASFLPAVTYGSSRQVTLLFGPDGVTPEQASMFKRTNQMTDQPALVEQRDRDAGADFLESWAPGPEMTVVKLARAFARHRQPDATRVAELEAENARLRDALGEICRDSNSDWTEKRVCPADVLDDIHKIATDAYYWKKP